MVFGNVKKDEQETRMPLDKKSNPSLTKGLFLLVIFECVLPSPPTQEFRSAIIYQT